MNDGCNGCIYLELPVKGKKVYHKCGITNKKMSSQVLIFDGCDSYKHAIDNLKETIFESLRLKECCDWLSNILGGKYGKCDKTT
jgi:hypothetical protein